MCLVISSLFRKKNNSPHPKGAFGNSTCLATDSIAPKEQKLNAIQFIYWIQILHIQQQ